LPNNKEITVTKTGYNDWGMFTMESDIYVKNLTTSTIEAFLSQTVLVKPSAGEFEVCWGGSCFKRNTDDIIYEGIFEQGYQMPPDFHIAFYPEEENYTIGKVKYELYPKNNPDDKSAITINFVYSEVGIEKLTQNDNVIIYRQNDKTYFAFNHVHPQMQLVIYNITGMETGRYNINSKIFSLPEIMSKGIYIYSVKTPEKVIYSGKYIQK